jgi:DNA-binding response OmpR family regulator
MGAKKITLAWDLPFIARVFVERRLARGMSEKSVIIVCPNENDSKALCSILEDSDYRPFSVSSLLEAAAILKTRHHIALIMDLDLNPPDNRLLRELRHEQPSLCLIGLSSRSFHPELEEALSRYIDACFVKSAGYEELLYWLKAVSSGSQYSKKKENDESPDEYLEAP